MPFFFEMLDVCKLSVDFHRKVVKLSEDEADELRSDKDRIPKMLSGLIKGTDHRKT